MEQSGGGEIGRGQSYRLLTETLLERTVSVWLSSQQFLSALLCCRTQQNSTATIATETTTRTKASDGSHGGPAGVSGESLSHLMHWFVSSGVTQERVRWPSPLRTKQRKGRSASGHLRNSGHLHIRSANLDQTQDN